MLAALAAPTIGHLDPEYLQIMDETRDLLQRVFATENKLTLAVSGTGSAGMEACVVNLIEPGDEVIVCVAGVFGARMADVAERYGATVHLVEVPWGQTVGAEAVAAALKAHPRTKWWASCTPRRRPARTSRSRRSRGSSTTRARCSWSTR